MGALYQGEDALVPFPFQKNPIQAWQAIIIFLYHLLLGLNCVQLAENDFKKGKRREKNPASNTTFSTNHLFCSPPYTNNFHRTGAQGPYRSLPKQLSFFRGRAFCRSSPKVFIRPDPQRKHFFFFSNSLSLSHSSVSFQKLPAELHKCLHFQVL